MAIDELKAALERQKTAGVETDYLEMLARLLEVPVETVARVSYAFWKIEETMLSAENREQLGTSWEKHLDRELCQAIQLGVNDGAIRIWLARMIRKSLTIHVPVEALVSAENKIALCNGCPERIECLAETLSTPEKCYSGKKSKLPVLPTRMTRTEVTVEAAQPAGTHVIPISRLRQPVTRW